MSKKIALATLSALLLAACHGMNVDEHFAVLSKDTCPHRYVRTYNQGLGEAVICCPVGSIGQDGLCVDSPTGFASAPVNEKPAADTVIAIGAPENQPYHDELKPVEDTQAQEVLVSEPVLASIAQEESKKQDFVLLTAPNGKGSAYCPAKSNSLAWNATEFKCCGKGMSATVVPSRGDSVCCPAGSTQARWIGLKWNDYECCPQGTIETRNVGTGNKYICCPQGNKGINGECISPNK